MRTRCSLALLAIAAQAPAQSGILDGVRRDPAVPAPRAVLGYELGAELTDHAGTVRCLEALGAASPRVHLERYGESWEGRSLVLAFVSAPENLARLDAIRAANRRLAAVRDVTEDEARRIVADLPATVWLGYTVHGDEASGTDAALWLAWHLASAQEDELVDTILRDAVVVIDPLQNPDGRERFVFGARQTRGRWPDAGPDAAVRDQPWPGGRVNHCGCDMNRDWFALTQPETRARVRAFQSVWPVAFVDVHEMGSNSTYYFGPPARPHNPELTPSWHEWVERFGRADAEWFDRFGFDYFTRERYDAFYPGYGDSWPGLQGAIAMTFEQASARGLVVEREDGTKLSYLDAVRRHAIASLATCETTARHRAALLERFFDDRRGAIAAARTGPRREFVLEPTRDAGRAARLAQRLVFQGVEVRRLSAAARNPAVRDHGRTAPARERVFPAGSYVVRLDQPAARLATALLARHQPMDPAFVAEQEALHAQHRGDDIYDVTAWSLPLCCGVDCFETDAFTEAELTSVEVTGLDAPAIEPERFAQAPHARVAYVIPAGRNDTAAALAALLRDGRRVHCAGKPFRIGERRFPAGSLVVKVAQNTDTLHALVHALDAAYHLDVLACDSGWVDDGVHFGSSDVRYVEPPKVALAWDRPASPYSAGSARQLLEWRYGLPVSLVRAARLPAADLDRFNVLILPDGGGYADVIGESGAKRIASWVQRGGTLVALGGGATRWLTRPEVGLLATAPEKRAPLGAPAAPDAPAEPPPGRPASQGDAYDRAILPADEDPAPTPGAILRVELDVEHWVAFGLGPFVDIVSTERDVYAPITLDKGRNLGVFAPRERLLQSGFAWSEKLDQLARKPFAVHQPHGDGHVVAFAEDPDLRGMTEGTDLLLLNAVLLGPSY